MIIGLIHPGSGLGDSVFSYILTRATAKRLNTRFGIIGDFKGKEFIQLNMGDQVFMKHHVDHTGKIIIDEPHVLYETKTPYFDPESQFVEDGTVVDGCIAQDSKYFDTLPLRDWITVTEKRLPLDLCIINLRGGEFRSVPDLILSNDYWSEAIKRMREINPDMKFEVHTDDLEYAKILFPDFPAVKNMSENWRSVRYAHYLILSNSAFGIIPALLNTNAKLIIAPRYWARRNTKQWSMPSNWYPKFTYI